MFKSASLASNVSCSASVDEKLVATVFIQTKTYGANSPSEYWRHTHSR